MSRETNKDFKELIEYIDSYSLNSDNQEYVSFVKSIHKHYFSMLSWNAEILHRKDDFYSASSISNERAYNYINESVSDISSSTFNWINGNYKTSRIMLRVSIENFIRGISSIENNSQLSEKNVYQLFDNAKDMAIFSKTITIKDRYNNLHSDYVLLCEDTHTASELNMENITSLSYFPEFNRDRALDCKNIYIRIVKNMNIVFCLIFSEFYHSIHHKNKENIMNSIPGSIKPILSGIE